MQLGGMEGAVEGARGLNVCITGLTRGQLSAMIEAIQEAHVHLLAIAPLHAVEHRATWSRRLLSITAVICLL